MQNIKRGEVVICGMSSKARLLYEECRLRRGCEAKLKLGSEERINNFGRHMKVRQIRRCETKDASSFLFTEMSRICFLSFSFQ